MSGVPEAGEGDLTSPDVSPDLSRDVALSSSFGAPSGGYSASPGMIGDFFNGGLNVFQQGREGFGENIGIPAAQAQVSQQLGQG